MNLSKKKFSAAILAGGKSSRFGSDKGLVNFRGKPLIEHVILVLKELAIDFYIISNNPHYQLFDVPVFNDSFNSVGPLGGLHAALTNCTTSHCFCVGCDLPFLNPGLFRAMSEFEKFEAVVPLFKGHPEPLASLYQRSILPEIHNHIEEGSLKMTDTIASLNHHWFEVDENCEFYNPHLFANINTQEDWERLK